MRKRKLYIIILSAITIICIVFGSIRQYGYGGMNDVLSIFGLQKWRGDYETSSYDLNAFQEINMDVSDLDITIQTGDTYQIELAYIENEMPNIKVEDNCLTVKQKKSFLKHNAKDYYIIVTVPENTELEDITLNSGYGDATMQGILLKSLDCNLDMGDFTGKEMQAEQTTVECDMGDTEIDNSILGTLSVTCDMGDVTLQQITSDETNIDCDMGNVALDFTKEQNAHYYKLEASLGDITYNQESEGNKFFTASESGTSLVFIDCDMGDIEVNDM